MNLDTLLLIIFSYAILSLLTAFTAYGRRIGLSSAFVLCFFMTPIIGFYAILKSDKNIRISRYTNRQKCEKCNAEITDEGPFCPQCKEEDSQTNQ